MFFPFDTGTTRAVSRLGLVSVYLLYFVWIDVTPDPVHGEGLGLFRAALDRCFGRCFPENDSLSDQDFINAAQAINGGVAYGPFLNFAIDGLIDSLGWSQGNDLDRDLAGSF